MEHLTSEELEQKREDAHKAMKQNRNWLWETDNGHLVCRCRQCGCGHIIPFYAYENPYNFCYHCGHSAADPRVLTLDEFLSTSGTGYLENWFEADEENSEIKYLFECAYIKGNVINIDELGGADYSDAEHMVPVYGKPYGMRVWSAKPTPEEQEGTPWQSD